MTDLSHLPHLDKALSTMLGTVESDVARILDKALGGGEVSVDEGTRLFDADGGSLLAIMATSDELRRRTNGDVVTYVVNRNINFTNVCIKRCGFCAFMGRVPAERTTLYDIRRRFDVEPDHPEALDLAQETAAERFGSYGALIKVEEFRYSGQRAPSLDGPTWTEVQLKRKAEKAASACAG